MINEITKYVPISNFPSNDGIISKELNEGFLKIKKEFNEKHLNGIDDYVSEILEIPLSELNNRLSAEQIDSVGLAWDGIESTIKRPMIIADETGFGKGRIMAALSIAGFKNGYNVLFITEKPNLFQDFFRDLVAVADTEHYLIPDVLHPNGKIISFTDVTKTGKPVVLSKPIKIDKHDTKIDILCTTYSQLKDENRKNFILDFLGTNGLVLLDEAHQSMGQSKAGESVQEILAKSVSSVYASATYAWQGKHLIPLRPVIQFIPKQLYPLLVKSIDLDANGDLRTLLAKQMSYHGTLLRREHPPAPPASSVFVKDTKNVIKVMNSIIELANYNLSLHEKYIDRKNLWMKFGKWLPPVLRQIGVWLKLDTVLQETLKAIKENKKVVIVIDSALKESELNLEKSKDENVENLYWRDTLTLDQEMLDSKLLSQQEIKIWNDYLKNIPDYFGSPIDVLSEKLKEHNINSSEISGRTPINKRKTTINEFNDGTCDVIVITRSGSTGISLHAGEKFKDQRVRKLITWDMPNQSAIGKQFKGRVRRKDQVVEPEYLDILLDTPYERKRIQKEIKKLEILNSQTSGREINEIKNELESDEGQFIFNGWLNENKDIGFKLGLFNLEYHPFGLGTIHKALLRLPLIGMNKSQNVFAYIEEHISRIKEQNLSWNKINYNLTDLNVKKDYFIPGTREEVCINKYEYSETPLSLDGIFDLIKNIELDKNNEDKDEFFFKGKKWYPKRIASFKHPDTGANHLGLMLDYNNDNSKYLETDIVRVLFSGESEPRKISYALIKNTYTLEDMNLNDFIEIHLNEKPKNIFCLNGPLWLIHSFGIWLQNGRMIFDENLNEYRWLFFYSKINQLIKNPWFPLVNGKHIALWLKKGGLVVSNLTYNGNNDLSFYYSDNQIHMKISQKSLNKLNKSNGLLSYLIKYKMDDYSRNPSLQVFIHPTITHLDKSIDIVIKYPLVEFCNAIFELYNLGLQCNNEEEKVQFNEPLSKAIMATYTS